MLLLENVAIGKEATQKSVVDNPYSSSEEVIDLVIDQNYDSENFACTQSLPNQWIQISFGRFILISVVEIYQSPVTGKLVTFCTSS